ncbi:hypothetical protein ACFQX4_20070 [Roseomonas sp. GCM10028921]
MLGGVLASWFAARELAVTITWRAPAGELALTPIHLRHWEFFFVMAAGLGLHALHALSLVQEGERPAGRVLVRDLVLEAARTLRSLSSVAGLRVAGGFPFGRLVGGRPARLRALSVWSRNPTTSLQSPRANELTP